jgi:hypothetical protein
VDSTPFRSCFFPTKIQSAAGGWHNPRFPLAQCGIEVNIAPGLMNCCSEIGWSGLGGASTWPVQLAFFLCSLQLFFNQIPAHAECPRGGARGKPSGYSRAEYDQACLRARNSCRMALSPGLAYGRPSYFRGRICRCCPVSSTGSFAGLICAGWSQPISGSVFRNEDLNYGTDVHDILMVYGIFFKLWRKSLLYEPILPIKYVYCTV